MDSAAFFVQVLEGLCDLHNDMSRQFLAEVSEADDLVEQLAAVRQLENNVVVLPRLGKFDELDDVRVVELAHDLHLFQDVGPLSWWSAVIVPQAGRKFGGILLEVI